MTKNTTVCLAPQTRTLGLHLVHFFGVQGAAFSSISMFCAGHLSLSALYLLDKKVHGSSRAQKSHDLSSAQGLEPRLKVEVGSAV